MRETWKLQFENFELGETPYHIRKISGAIFCDHLYDTVFMDHNGAESFYAAKGFRGRTEGLMVVIQLLVQESDCKHSGNDRDQDLLL